MKNTIKTYSYELSFKSIIAALALLLVPLSSAHAQRPLVDLVKYCKRDTRCCLAYAKLCKSKGHSIKGCILLYEYCKAGGVRRSGGIGKFSPGLRNNLSVHPRLRR